MGGRPTNNVFRYLPDERNQSDEPHVNIEQALAGDGKCKEVRASFFALRSVKGKNMPITF